ncbi:MULTISPECIES: membrane protein [Leuconostoc]|uniref:Integral membrane protein n=1 Tax=Leuconostoc kimchii (strain IMSNU 11154 / KCTC 2386 / IH25) TaxID=762051 RepID=D5T2G0_LEUKI|nr:MULTISPECIES: membrane protein [Leuconostoc]ADG40459.1 integral membrane protein [Leuconostoc kimchii IMSNU 11154]AEJ31616.1 integral membrane protein [Leuconostoc sp. C2]
MKTKEMTEANNLLRESLNKENKVFYENLLLYIRIEGFARDEHKIETQLLSILQDILEAQNEGVSAAGYLGKDPKIVADEILSEMPRHIWEVIRVGLYMLLTYIYICLLPSLMIAERPLDVGMLGISGALLYIDILIGFKYSGRAIYQVNTTLKNKYLRYFVIWIVASVAIAPIYLVNIFLKTPLRLRLDGGLGIAVILLALISGLYFILRAKDKTLLWPFAVFLVSAGVMGIVTRLPKLNDLLLHTTNGRYWIAGIIMVLLLLFYLLSFIALKKIKKQNQSY